ncbi:MAG: trans-2-enoyl-CoA reductase family protein [Oscillospiraceae bacterium]|nr:trans-2-enoyl-CoA reductase family protein [Oscillospiraceae bacterium]
MIIEPKVKGFICITSHPKGCEKNILNNIKYLSENDKITIPEIKNVLVIGASTGYGLASAITASFALDANVIGVSFEKNAQNDRNRTATAGMYNLAAYQREANKKNLYLKNIIGDAFSNETKEKVCEIIVGDGVLDVPPTQHQICGLSGTPAPTQNGVIDMIIYSIAAPVRIDPETGERYNSVLKPIGKEYKSKGIDLTSYKLNEVTIPPATDEEIQNTVKVMGGEDLSLWVDVLTKQNLLRENAIIISYSYTGPPVTHDIYLNGSVGAAKNHLKQTSDKLNKSYKIKSYVSVNKALVTQASAAIPVMPLYISILFKTMKEKNLHENCIQQIYRLFKKIQDGENLTDENGYIRIDDLEMRDDVQREVAENWVKINDDNLEDLADLNGYKKDFMNLFGFDLDGVDYNKDVEIEVDEDSLGIVNLLK